MDNIEIRGDRISKHVKRNLYWYFLAFIVCGGAALICVLAYPQVLPTAYKLKDPSGQVRSIFDMIIKLFIVLGAGTGWLLYHDGKMNSNLFGGIIRGNVACATFAGLSFLGICILGCYL